jgi:hypothetical protein
MMEDPLLVDLITPEDLAERLKISVGTVYNRLGRLSQRDGVVRIGSKCTRINWPVFWQRLCEGKLDFSVKGREQRTQR